MASQDVAANSRLAEMQMRFQRRQMLEREQKKMALTGIDTSASDAPMTHKTIIGNGKVRQMFDDRRRGVGIDRSHPLRPIMSSSSSTSVQTRTSTLQSTTKRLAGGANISKRPVIPDNTLKKSQTLTAHNIANKNFMANSSNGSVFNNNLDELDNLENETFPNEFSTLSLNESHTTANRSFDNNGSENNNILGRTIVINKKSSPKTNGIKLNPVVTKKSPTPAAATAKFNNQSTRTVGNNNRLSPSSKTHSNSSTVKSPLNKPAAPQTTKNVKATGTKTSNNKPATFVLAVKPPPRISTPPPGMAACQYCQRNFVEERLDKHEEVCGRMTSKKRKIFDASKHRVKGTEAEKYLKKGKVSVTRTHNPVVTSPVANSSSQGVAGKKNNWRKKHEEFIAAIREAKKVQAHLAKGGKLSDLPPPPPSENPDYIQCPHCSRRFNESAAERHIPKCANMKHNKPKPGANVQKKRF